MELMRVLLMFSNGSDLCIRVSLGTRPQIIELMRDGEMFSTGSDLYVGGDLYGVDRLNLVNLSVSGVSTIGSSGITTIMNYAVGKSGAVLPQTPIRTSTDGLHMKVWHRNHGMHADGNVVTLKGAGSDVTPTTLSAAILSTSTASIGIGATTNFAAFENVAVGSTNAGYVKIGEEIIKYTGVSGATLTGITRAQEGTIAANHAADDQVYKYEMDGVSLRRINTNHNLNEVTVRAERSSLELKLDKRVFNVGKDLSNKGGTAEEILENIPSIDLDIEGNISLRGSQSVRILIDGKPASMMGFDGPNAFKQLQGNEIDKVEIITNPSSRYSLSLIHI